MRSVRIDNIPVADNPFFDSVSLDEREIQNEKSFKRTIALERKRSERSQEPFLLMLVDVGSNPESKDSQNVLEKMTSVLMGCSRDTDVIGYYRERRPGPDYLLLRYPTSRSSVPAHLIH